MIKGCLVLAGFIVVLALLRNSIAESNAPEIILENGFYYVIQPNGEKIAIVKEWEPQSPNRAKLSPDRQYVTYTTSNGLGFESEGRDLFYCKIDGTERTFLQKSNLCIDNWVWLSKGNRDFLVVVTFEGVAWALDFNKKKLVLSFHADSVEKIEGTECCKTFGLRSGTGKGREICADNLLRIRDEETPSPQVYVNWMGDQVYLSSERDPVFGYKEVLERFAVIYGVLPPQEKILYKATHEKFVTGPMIFEEVTSPTGNKIAFSISGIVGKFDLDKRKVEYLDIRGELSLKAFRSPRGKYLGVLKTEHTGIKKLIVLSKKPDASWGNVLTKEFKPDEDIYNLEWSKQNETQIYYSLKQGAVTKDSCVIDLTKTGRKEKQK